MLPERHPDLLTLRPGELEWRQIDDEIVALDVRSASYLTLNGTGALLWRMLAAGATRSDLVDALVDDYDVMPVTAAADIDAFLTTLAQQALLAA